MMQNMQMEEKHRYKRCKKWNGTFALVYIDNSLPACYVYLIIVFV